MRHKNQSDGQHKLWRQYWQNNSERVDTFVSKLGQFIKDGESKSFLSEQIAELRELLSFSQIRSHLIWDYLKKVCVYRPKLMLINCCNKTFDTYDATANQTL